jgi:DNA-binding NtrC family response regulator
MKTILAVDDRPEICRLLTAMLTEFNVLSAHSSVEAMNILRSTRVDLVVTDMQMERPDAGIRLMNHCDHVGTPVLMMSGSDPLTNEEKEIVAGRFLDKPFKKAQLLEAINSVLNIETLEEQSSQEALMSA